MPSAVSVAGDVVPAAVALAGLVLVFLGAISSGYAAFQKLEQSTVRANYQLRAWFAFVGFVLALLAAALALVGKWLKLECAALSGMVLLFVALVWVLLAGLRAVREIR